MPAFAAMLIGIPRVGVAQNAQATPAQEPAEQRVVALAFTGCCEKYLTFAAPLLQKNQFGATFFVSKEIDALHPILGPQFLTWPQVKQLSDMGFEIGNDGGGTDRPSTPAAKQLFISQLEAVERTCVAIGVPKPTLFYHANGFAYRPALQILADKGYLLAVEHMSVFGHYDPQLDHPFIAPATGFFYGSDDENRKRFLGALENWPPHTMLILAFNDLEYPSHRDMFRDFVKYLVDHKYRTVPVGQLAGNAGGAMRAVRLWRAGGEMPMTADTGAAVQPAAITPLQRQLEALVIPKVDFDNLPLASALEFLKQNAAKISNGALQPGFIAAAGVNDRAGVTLHLADAPFMEVLRYLGDLAGVDFVVEQYAISVKPRPAAAPRVTAKIPPTPARLNTLGALVLPSVKYEQASLGSMLDALSRQAADVSRGSVKPSFVFLPSTDLSTQVTLHVENIPFTEALHYLGDLAGVDFSFDQYAISVVPKSAGASSPIAKIQPTASQLATLNSLMIPEINLKETTLGLWRGISPAKSRDPAQRRDASLLRNRPRHRCEHTGHAAARQHPISGGAPLHAGPGKRHIHHRPLRHIHPPEESPRVRIHPGASPIPHALRPGEIAVKGTLGIGAWLGSSG